MDSVVEPKSVADTDSPHERIDATSTETNRSLYRRAIDAVFGYDYFVSYRWTDGRSYAVALARELKARGYEVFLDSEDYATGDNWKRIGEWTLNRTSQMILVCTAGALEVRADESPVEREVRVFSLTNRRIIPIAFVPFDEDGKLDNAKSTLALARSDSRVVKYIPREILTLTESTAQLSSGPSAETIESLVRSFNLVRQDTKRIRWLTRLAFILLFLTVLAVAAAIFAAYQTKLARKQRERAEDNLDTAEQRLYVSDLIRMPTLFKEHQYLRMDELLSRHWPCPGEKDRRSFDWYYWWKLAHPELHSFPGKSATFAFSDDSKLLASVGRSSAGIWNVETGELQTKLFVHPGGITSVAFSFDRQLVAMGSDDGCILVMDANTGSCQSVIRHSDDTSNVQAQKVDLLSFSRDSKRLLGSSKKSAPRIWNVSNGELVSTLQLPADPSESVFQEISNCGFYGIGNIVAVCQAGDISLFDGDSGKPEGSIVGRHVVAGTMPEEVTSMLLLADDGKWIATQGKEPGILIRRIPGDEKPLHIPGNEVVVKVATFAADGSQLCWFSESAIKIWNVRKQDDIASIPIEESVTSLALSPDKKRLLAVLQFGGLLVWNLDSLETPALKLPIDGIQSAAFLDDTQFLAVNQSGTISRVHLGEFTTEIIRQGHTQKDSGDSGDGDESISIFMNDGRQLAIGWGDGTVSIIDAKSGLELRTFKVHASGVRYLAQSRENGMLISGADDAVIEWNPTTGERLQHTRLSRVDKKDSGVRAFSRDASLYATGFTNGVSIVKLPTNEVVCTLADSKEGLGGYAFSPDNQWIVQVSRSDPPYILIWNASTGKLERRINVDWPERSSAPETICFSPNGRMICAASTDIVALWHFDSGERIGEYAIGGYFNVYSRNSLAFSNDGEYIATGHLNSDSHLWHVRRFLQRGILDTGVVREVQYSPDGARIGIVQTDGVSLWDVEAEKNIASFRTQNAGTMAFSGSGDQIIIGWSNLGEEAAPDLMIIDASTGRRIRLVDAFPNGVNAVVYSNDGSRFAVSQWLPLGGGNEIKVFDSRTGSLQSTMTGHSDMIDCMALNPTNGNLVSASWDGTVRIWDFKNFAQTAIFDSKESETVKQSVIDDVSIAPDGQTVAFTGRHVETQLWDWRTKRLRKKFGDLEGNARFTPDGRCLATMGSIVGRIKIWDIATEQERLSLPVLSTGDSLTISPRGDTIVSTRQPEYGLVDVWRAATNEEVLQHYLFVPKQIYDADVGDLNLVRACWSMQQHLETSQKRNTQDLRRQLLRCAQSVLYQMNQQGKLSADQKSWLLAVENACKLHGISNKKTGLSKSDLRELRRFLDDYRHENSRQPSRVQSADQRRLSDFKSALQLAISDRNIEYRSICSQALETYGRRGAVFEHIAPSVLRTCSLIPFAIENRDAYESLIYQTMRPSGATDGDIAAFIQARVDDYDDLTVVGLGLYRLGKLGDACEVLHVAARARPEGMTARLFLAMAQQRLGKTRDAEVLFQHVSSDIAKFVGDNDNDVHIRNELTLFASEAKKLFVRE